MKKQVILLIAVLLAAVFFGACGCPANLKDPVSGDVEKSVIPAPEQSVPAHAFTPGLPPDDIHSGEAKALEDGWDKI